jgi:hypothetical protein
MNSMDLTLGKFVEILKANYLAILAVSSVLLHLAPYYIFGQNVLIGIHDVFDSYIVWYKTLVRSGMIFANSSTPIPQIMDGIPRIAFGTEFNIFLWLFYLFDPFTAYVINLTVMHLVGFAGMYILLKTHFLREEKYKIVNYGVAICFAILPVWPPGGLSISSLPLALYAFMNIRSKQGTKKDLLILLIIPLYSSFVFSYLFFLVLIGSLWLLDTIRTRDLNLKFFTAIGLLAAEFLIVEYRLVFDMVLGSEFVSHRVEFRIPDLTLLDALKQGLRDLILGQYHAGSYHGLVIIFAVCFAILVLFASRYNHMKKALPLLGICGISGLLAALLLVGFNPLVNLIFQASSLILGSFFPLTLMMGVGAFGFLLVILYFWTKRSEQLSLVLQENRRFVTWMVSIIGTIIVIALWYGLWSSVYLVPLKQQFTILRTIQLSRFHWLNPLLWYLLFAVSLAIVQKGISFEYNKIELGKAIAVGLILLQLFILFPYNWEVVSVSESSTEHATYNQFYATGIFQQIKDDIGSPQDSYKILNIGFHPAISQFNGFYTLDGYFNNYPLEYKHRFRNIISYELAKNDEIREYFDGWGSRCYVLTAELGLNFFCTKDDTLILNDLELNTTALHEMDCSYIFSAVNITNAVDNDLQLNGVYENPQSIWRIFLYEVI